MTDCQEIGVYCNVYSSMTCQFVALSTRWPSWQRATRVFSEHVMIHTHVVDINPDFVSSFLQSVSYCDRCLYTRVMVGDKHVLHVWTATSHNYNNVPTWS